MTRKRKFVYAVSALLIVLAIGIANYEPGSQSVRPNEPASPKVLPVGRDLPTSATILRFQPHRHPAASPEAYAAYHAARRELLLTRRSSAALQQVRDGLAGESSLLVWIDRAVHWEMIDAIPSLRRLTTHNDALVADNAWEALAKLGDPAAIDFLLEKATDPISDGWSFRLLHFLKDYHSPELENRLVAQWRLVPQEAAETQRFYAIVLASLGRPEAAEVAVDWLNGKWPGRPPNETIFALANAENTGLKKSLEKLAPTLEESQFRLAVHTALAKFGNKEAEKDIVEAVHRAMAMPFPYAPNGRLREGLPPKTKRDYLDYHAWRECMPELPDSSRLPLLRSTLLEGKDSNMWALALKELARHPSEESRSILWEVAPAILDARPPYEKRNVMTPAGKALILFSDPKSEELARHLLNPPVEFECMKFLAETRGYDGIFVLPLQF